MNPPPIEDDYDGFQPALQQPTGMYPQHPNGYHQTNGHHPYTNILYNRPGLAVASQQDTAFYVAQSTIHVAQNQQISQTGPFHASNFQANHSNMSLSSAPVQFIEPSQLQMSPVSSFSLFPGFQTLQQPSHLQPSSQSFHHSQQAMHIGSTQTLDAAPRQSPQVNAPARIGQQVLNRRKSTGTASGITKPSTATTSLSDPVQILLGVGNECLAKAAESAMDVAESMKPAKLQQYQELVATGLECFEAAWRTRKLHPRLEARVRLQYASTLVQETTNYMEAETVLTEGISLCEKHRLLDLKYCFQFLLMKTVFERNPKPAFKLVDRHIKDCATNKHVHWYYVFRFLKATFYIQAGMASDNHALENLRGLEQAATSRDDQAIAAMAFLMEGLAHLGTTREDSITRAQTCLAEVSKRQLDPTVHAPQIELLKLLLDLSCSIRQKTSVDMVTKLKNLQDKMEKTNADPAWQHNTSQLQLPIKKQASYHAQPTISSATSAVIKAATGDSDFLVLSTIGKQESWILTILYQGLVCRWTQQEGQRVIKILRECLNVVQYRRQGKVLQFLSEARQKVVWLQEVSCYLRFMIGMQAADEFDWNTVHECVQKIEQNRPPPGVLDMPIAYLSGAFFQGTGNTAAALKVWQSEQFRLPSEDMLTSRLARFDDGLRLMAALNLVWMKEADVYAEPGNPRREAARAFQADLLRKLQPLCESYRDPEVRLAYRLVIATSHTLNTQLRITHARSVLNMSKTLQNTMATTIGLNILRCYHFGEMADEQAMRISQACRINAEKLKNVLWMSIASGFLEETTRKCARPGFAMIMDDSIRFAEETRRRLRQFRLEGAN